MTVRSFHPRRERGAVIIWFALFLLVILGFVAIGVDIAKLMATRSQLQNAADAAALAGASAVDFNTGELVPDMAKARVQQTASLNKAFIQAPEPVLVSDGDILVDAAAGTCEVIVRREGGNSIVTHFANVVGVPTLQMTASAKAKVEPAGSVLCGIAPLGVTPEAGQDFQPGCNNPVVLKLPGGTGSNGNYNALQLPTCADGPCSGMPPTGANTFRCLLEKGYCCDVNKNQVLNTQTGNMSGPTSQAIQKRFEADKVKTQNICYSAYKALGGNDSRVVIVPITTAPVSNTVTVLRFGAFFLRNIPAGGSQSEVDGEFIYSVVAGGAGGGSGAGSTAYAIHLIQ